MRRYMTNLISVISITILSACDGVPPYDAAANEALAQKNPNFRSFTHEVEGQPLYGVRTGQACEAAVVFIHGAPGDWQAWGRYLGDRELQAKAELIAIDRPGFAQSGGGAPVLELEDQANVIVHGVLEEHPGPFVFVGHSYGGPVQMEIAQDFPESVAGLVVLAGAVDPVLQASRWYHHLGDMWVAEQILPADINVTTQEMLSLPAELEAQQAGLGEIKAPVTVIQGEDDWLVPVGNADYLKAQLTLAQPKIIKLTDQGHFLPWEQYDLVKQEVMEQLGSVVCQ